MAISNGFSKGQALALFQRKSAELTDIAALSPSNGDFLKRVGGAWIAAAIGSSDLTDALKSPPAIGDTAANTVRASFLTINEDKGLVADTRYPLASLTYSGVSPLRGLEMGYYTRTAVAAVQGGYIRGIGGLGNLALGGRDVPLAILINATNGNVILSATSTDQTASEKLIVNGAISLQTGAGLDTPNTTYPKIIGGSSVMGTNGDLLLIARGSAAGHVGIITGTSGGTAGVRLSVRNDGKVHVGEWHTPAALLSVLLNDTGTSDTATVAILGRRSSNTPVDNFAAELKFQLKSSSTNDQDVAAWIAAWGTATHLSRAGKLIGRVWNVGTPVDVLTLTPNGAGVGGSQAYYFGAEATDGTWRIIRSGNDLKFQRRESGSYVDKSTIAA